MSTSDFVARTKYARAQRLFPVETRALGFRTVFNVVRPQYTVRRPRETPNKRATGTPL